MSPVLIAAAVMLALWALGWLAMARSGYTVITGLDPRMTVRERILKIGSALLSAGAVVWLVLSVLPAPTPAGSFAVHGSWKVGLVFHFILWLALAGQLHLIACVVWLGGYVAEKGPRRGAGTPSQRLIAGSARAATALANEKPVVALHGFLLFGLLCVAGLGLAHDRQAWPTEAGLAHDGFWDLSEQVEPWESIARLKVLRDPDPERRGWQLRWERADGSSALHLTADNVWQLDGQTLDRVVAWHEQHHIAVFDARP